MDRVINEGRILIFNPCKHSLGKDVFRIITKETKHRVFVLENVPSNLEENCEPHLIFAIFPPCQKTCEQLFNLVFDAFPLIPSIAIINSLHVCLNCPILERRIWNIISTPFSQRDILLNIQKYLPFSFIHNTSQMTSNIKLKAKCDILKGNSLEILQVKERIFQVAPYDVTVLLIGETGTGKELCAKLLHFLSIRSDKPFIPVNCGAIPKDLFENELFGHKKGAFTHAHESQFGLIKSANGGTLFLDEIESLPESTQVKLLRFLEEKKYKPLGQTEYVGADVRIIATAKEDLWKLIQKKKFREDLFYRLNVFQIELAPLRERCEDIPVLVDHFIRRYAVLYNKEIKGITPQALFKLMHNEWPGNIRELENVVQNLVITNTGGWIEIKDIKLNRLTCSDWGVIQPLKKAKQKLIEDFEKSYLKNLMYINNGNISKAAKFAQKERSAFCRLLKKYNIIVDTFRHSKSYYEI